MIRSPKIENNETVVQLVNYTKLRKVEHLNYCSIYSMRNNRENKSCEYTQLYETNVLRLRLRLRKSKIEKKIKLAWIEEVPLL